MASGIVPTTEGVGVHRYDLMIGVDTDGVDTPELDTTAKVAEMMIGLETVQEKLWRIP
jgi:hypothetical protein